jgi:hypothetical protein
VNSNKGTSANATRTLLAVSGELLGSLLIRWKATVDFSLTSISENESVGGAPSKS